MAVKLTVECRNAMANAIIGQIDGNATPGSLKIYNGSQPLSPSTAITSQNILSEHNLTYPCAEAVNGILVFSAISDDDFANATGTASWARFFNGLGDAVADASISVVGGGGDLQMNTVNIVINGPVRFTSLQWTMPGG